MEGSLAAFLQSYRLKSRYRPSYALICGMWGRVYFNAYLGCWENSVLWGVGSLECRNGFLLAVVWGHPQFQEAALRSVCPPSSSDINCILNPPRFRILSDFLFFDQQRKFLLLNGV